MKIILFFIAFTFILFSNRSYGVCDIEKYYQLGSSSDTIEFTIAYKLEITMDKKAADLNYSISSITKDCEVQGLGIGAGVCTFMLKFNTAGHSVIKLGMHGRAELFIEIDNSAFKGMKENISYLGFGFNESKIPKNKFLFLKANYKVKKDKKIAYIEKLRYKSR